ncbi:LutC/YkgG family protein [Streptomyces sp. NPDC003327]
MSQNSRDRILGRIRHALADAPPAAEPARDYLVSHVSDDPAALLDLLHENLTDYRATVHRTTEPELAAVLAQLLDRHDVRTLAVPPGLPADWLSATTAEQRPYEHAVLTLDELDATDAVVTTCALAIAETGTIVLDAGPGQGPRVLTLVPDLHICVVRADQVVASVPQAVSRLDPVRPLTWISGPSATSDIELDRVEGVHGPRRLDVVLVGHGE